MAKDGVKRICSLSGVTFEVSPKELALYERLEIPLPTLAPEERLRRRLAFRNERCLYYRQCSGSKQRVISVYSPELSFPVYSKDYWWSDKWDPLAYGQEFDFKRGFFEQYFEMRNKVPRMNMILSHCENCDYAPYSVSSKNCYRVVSCVNSEDVHYSYQTNSSRDCLDCALCFNCELCYECVYCLNAYNLNFCKRSENCSDSWFLIDCIGCRNCFGCSNLRNKEYYFLNEKLEKSDYLKRLEGLALNTTRGILKTKKTLQQFMSQFPTSFQFGERNEGLITGYHIHRSKDCHYCFDAHELEDCSYIYVSPGKSRDSIDCNYSIGSELTADCMSGVNAYNSKFLLHSWDVKDSTYCEECFYSSSLFGCASLRSKKYCILNKEYSKADYEKLKAKIIDHMKHSGEYGEFFPMKYSPFSYNESMAIDHFKISKEEALKRGYAWRDKDTTEYREASLEAPDSIDLTADSICDELLACAPCGKNYKIQKMEFNFYKLKALPVPQDCPDCRYSRRLEERARWRLLTRNCCRCNCELLSALPPSLAKSLACKDCYTYYVH